MSFRLAICALVILGAELVDSRENLSGLMFASSEAQTAVGEDLASAQFALTAKVQSEPISCSLWLL